MAEHTLSQNQKKLSPASAGLSFFFCSWHWQALPLSTKTEPAFRAGGIVTRGKCGTTGRADGAQGVFIKDRIGSAEIVTGNTGGTQVLLFENLLGLVGISQSDLQLEVGAASALAAIAAFTGNERRNPFSGQEQLVGF